MKSQITRDSRRLVQDFIRQIEQQLELRQMSVADLAKNTGLSRQYIYRILNGQHVPSLSVAETIASKLGLSLKLTSAE